MRKKHTNRATASHTVDGDSWSTSTAWALSGIRPTRQEVHELLFIGPLRVPYAENEPRHQPDGEGWSGDVSASRPRQVGISAVRHASLPESNSDRLPFKPRNSGKEVRC